MNAPSVAGRLRRGIVLTGLASAMILVLFVTLDFDSYFDKHYPSLGLTGLAYEIGDHVILPFLVLLLPLLMAVPWVIRRSLAPLGTAAEEISRVDEWQRGFRVPIQDVPVEAVPFVSSINSLLARLEFAAGRQEAFAADVAHELKNPLAILTLELDRLGDLAKPLHGEVGAMSRLVDQLLLLAQLDAEAAAKARRDSIDLADIARVEVARIAPSAVGDRKQVELETAGRPSVIGRREAVAAALRNLLENALRVTPVGGRVIVMVGPGSSIRVRDEGPGLSAAELSSLRHRFARADHASSSGAGLGLAIVTKIMEAHHGRLTTDPRAREMALDFRHPEDQETAESPEPPIAS